MANPMTYQNPAAKSGPRRGRSTSDSSTNPVSETRPFGVAGEWQRITDALVRIADAAENQSRTAVQTLPPVALSIEDSARYIGVDVASIQHLVRTRQLHFAQIGSQRGRVILVEDLRSFLKERRQGSDKEIRRKK
jgi:hypothetical protein